MRFRNYDKLTAKLAEYIEHNPNAKISDMRRHLGETEYVINRALAMLGNGNGNGNGKSKKPQNGFDYKKIELPIDRPSAVTAFLVTGSAADIADFWERVRK